MQSKLVSELTLMGLEGYKFRAASPDEAHGPCPRCGGVDRLVVHAVRPWPSWLWMCRNCHPDWAWADEMNPRLKVDLTPEQKSEFARERVRLEQEREAQLARRLDQFTTAELWQELHRRMTDQNRQWWRVRGVPDDWQDFLQLGYTPEKIITDGYKTPAYTIPYLRPGYKAITMQYRLVNPPNESDKYRFEAGLPSAYYMTMPTEEIADQVVICEGAIKAMVTRISGGLSNEASILGVPGKNSWGGVVEAIKKASKVWIIMDPDGEREAVKLAKEIGANARIVTLPEKIDDAMICLGMTKDDLKHYFKYARKL